jgi:cyanophycin synthetase
VRHDDDLRGRQAEEIDRLICEGINRVDPAKKVTIIQTELEAVDELLNNAVTPGSVSVIFADNIKAVVTKVQGAINKHQANRVREVA